MDPRAVALAERLVDIDHHESLLIALMREHGSTISVADDGNAEVEYPDTEADDAACEYVEDGDWGDSDETSWVTVYTWTRLRLGSVCVDLDDRASHSIAIEPDEPACTEAEHDWQSPHDIVGGIESNPGVWGHGGGVVINECCVLCGCKRVTDTWAQNPETGEQGLRSVRYEPGAYADDIPTREMREMRAVLSCETLADGAAYVLATLRAEPSDRCLRDLARSARERAKEVADYVELAGPGSAGYSRSQAERAQRLALWIATAHDDRERRAAVAVIAAMGWQ